MCRSPDPVLTTPSELLEVEVFLLARGLARRSTSPQPKKPRPKLSPKAKPSRWKW